MDKLPVATDQMPLKGFTVTDKLSVTRFVHGSVHKTRRDGLRRGRHRRPGMNAAVRPLRSTRRPETKRDGGDVRRMAHNPEARVQIPPGPPPTARCLRPH